VNDELQMTWTELIVAFCYRDTDKSLALPEMKKKLMFVSEWRKFPSTPCLAGKEKLDESSRLDVVEVARVPDMLPSWFTSLSR